MRPVSGYNLDSFYVNGDWVKPRSHDDKIGIVNPATAEIIGSLVLGNVEDVDDAVAAARAAFKLFQRTSKEERIGYLEKILVAYRARYEEFVEAISVEMGSPITLSRDAQAYTGIEHLESTIQALKSFELREEYSGYSLNYEAVGVCGLITPWNWPISQLVAKVAPAIAAGCTMIVKPSEFSPLSAQLFAEVIDEAALPDGVFNLIHGEGQTVGAAISHHPDIDMVSFTGSTRAGRAITIAAADTIKRVSLELGGKGANIVFADAPDLDAAAQDAGMAVFYNSGQVCVAATRLLVEESVHDEFLEKVKKVGETMQPGDPLDPATMMGTMVDSEQTERVKSYIEIGAKEGAKLAYGGKQVRQNTGGYYLEPTIFDGVKNDMRIAREEIFGPVLSTLTFKDPEEALSIANDSIYGLQASVWTRDINKAHKVARKLKAGTVNVNNTDGGDITVPFGGYKQSGIGRDKSLHAYDKYSQLKTTYIELK